MDVKEYLRSKAKAHPKKVVFPETSEERIVRAARQALDLGIAYPILVGKPETVSAFAGSIGLTLEGIAIADPTDEAVVDGYVGRFLEINSTLPAKALEAHDEASAELRGSDGGHRRGGLHGCRFSPQHG